MESVNHIQSMALSEEVERYAAGRMQAEEEQEFEVLMLERPELAAQVEAAQKMRMALRQLQTSGELEGLIGRKPGNWLHYALAAGVVSFLAGGALLTLQRSHHPSLATASALAGSMAELDSGGRSVAQVTETFILAGTRSNEATPLSVVVGRPPVALQIFPSTSSDSGAYRVTLTRVSGDGGPLADVKVRTGRDGSLRVFLDPRRLTPGEYQISVLGTSPERFGLHAIAAIKP